MDVYDEVDRRETDAGKIPGIVYKNIVFNFIFIFVVLCKMCDELSCKYLVVVFFFSVVGHSKPQYTCYRHHGRAFSARQS